MEIEILRKNNDDLLKQNQVRWSRFMQESNNAITLIAVIGLIPLTSALLSLRNNDSFWGPNSSVGLSLILLAIFYFIRTYRSKKKHFKQIQQYLNSHSNRTDIIEIVFTDSGISYKDFEMNFDVQ